MSSTLRITEIKESHITDDHTAEGFLATNKNGSIIHVFRLDPSGDHIGNNGYIAKRISEDNGKTWSQPQKVYDSNEYDDRNVHGGITKSGRIVCFFREFDAENNSHIGKYTIHSDDGGSSWSEKRKIKGSPATVYGTGQMFYNDDLQKYCMTGYTTGYLEIRFSDDGINWDEYVVIDDRRGEKKLSEIAGAYVGDNRIICIARNNERSTDNQLMQYVSVDGGENWDFYGNTNIPKDHWGTAPQLFYDKQKSLMIAMTVDRRSQTGSNSNDERLYIYSNDANESILSSKTWVLQTSFIRPNPNPHRFYGYPSYTKMSNGNYLITFSDNYKRENGKENASLYQFELFFDSRNHNNAFIKVGGTWLFVEKKYVKTSDEWKLII